WIASTIFGVHYPLRNFRICQTVLRRRLQKERIRKRIYKTRDLARADIFDYIEVFYNRARRHSHLGGVSPEAFEQASS
ncbi:IS3 family transposase, partial [Klebsiella pneumoniae]